MIACPKCGHGSEVTETRSLDGRSCRRRRQCIEADCSHRFTTYEAIPFADLGEVSVQFVPTSVVRAIERAMDAIAHAKEEHT